MHYDYDVAVLGGGAAGLTAAGFAANFGAKTIMIEKAQLGGDCTWTGCVPSKSLLHAAKVAHTARTARTVGIETGDVTVDFPKVMEHVRSLREEVYEDADRPEIFEAMGVEVVQGAARFVHPHRLAITEQETEQGEERVVTFRYAVVCTGGRAAVPPIEGLDAVDYLTNHSLFEISEQPARLAIIGGGPIGVEMSQAFGRLGTEVVVLDRADRILGRDDPDHARMLREALGKEGVQFELGVDVDKVSQEGETKTVTYSREGQAQTVEVDALLIATGRTPNIENLGLVEAGVGFTEKGIRVDEQCRTSAPHIFAAGDVTGEYQLTHMAEHMARTAVSTIVLKVPSSLDRAHVPWVTFAEPELAHLGASEAELRERGEAFEVYRFPYTKVDRAITEGATTGELKVFATKWRGTILGASVLGERAGELMSLYALAMKNGVTLREVADTIHAYPTYALGARRAADQWYAQKQYPWLVGGIKALRGFQGTVPDAPEAGRVV